MKPKPHPGTKQQQPDSSRERPAWRTAAALAVLVILTVAAFRPALDGEFTAWDDDQYITKNPDLEAFSPSYLARAFMRTELGNYHPLTMVSFSMNYRGSDPYPEPFHRTNLALHLLNLLLVFLLVRKLARNDIVALITAVLFALHAGRVESVAWISARKELLYAFFFLLSLLTYFYYLSKGKTSLYWLSLLFFVLSLLSKASAVVLAPLLVLADWYSGRKVFSKSVLLGKVPFFVLAVAAGLFAIRTQAAAGTLYTQAAVSFPERIVLAAGNLWLYVRQLMFPAGLKVYYPYPLAGGGGIETSYYLYAGLFFLLAIVAGFLIRRLAEKKVILFGSLFFLTGIFPLLQLIPVGQAIMADRYAYLPGLGIFLVLAWLAVMLAGKAKRPAVIYAALLLLVFPLFLQTRAKTSDWKNTRALVDAALGQDPGIPQFLLLRGQLSEASGDRESALEDYSLALGRDSLFVPALNNRAVLLAWKREFGQAAGDLRRALSRDPGFQPSWSNLGFVLTRSGQFTEAISALDRALELNEDDPMALGNRGWCYLNTGKPEQALEDLDRSLALERNNPFACFYRAKTRLALRDTASACNDLRQAMNLGYAHYIDSEPQDLYDMFCRKN